MKLSLSHLSFPKAGESVSGDAVITRVEDDAILLAVVDSLGHGPPAAVVADKAREYLDVVPLSKSARGLTEGLHDALRGTRGAAAMCCLIKEGRLEGCGVGNVELRSLTSRVPVVLTPGILGVSLQRTRVFEGARVARTRLFRFDDGLSPRMDLLLYERLSTDEACRALMEKYRRSHDDATLLVVDVESVP